MFSPVTVHTPLPGVPIDGVLVLPAGEDAEQFLVDAAPAVEPLVDDERLLRPVRGKIELELAKRRGVHRSNVQIADVAATEPGDHVASIADPPRVLQIGEGGPGRRSDG